MGSLGVRVLSSGYAQLYHTRRGVVYLHLVVTSQAIINGGEIHCQTKDGRTQIYRINNSETGVVGPIRTF